MAMLYKKRKELSFPRDTHTDEMIDVRGMIQGVYYTWDKTSYEMEIVKVG